MWCFPVTGTLPFLTLFSPLTVSSGDEYYGGPVSTGLGRRFRFGDGNDFRVYVSTVQNDTCCTGYYLLLHVYTVVLYLLSVHVSCVCICIIP